MLLHSTQLPVESVPFPSVREGGRIERWDLPVSSIRFSSVGWKIDRSCVDVHVGFDVGDRVDVTIGIDIEVKSGG